MLDMWRLLGVGCKVHGTRRHGKIEQMLNLVVVPKKEVTDLGQRVSTRSKVLLCQKE